MTSMRSQQQYDRALVQRGYDKGVTHGFFVGAVAAAGAAMFFIKVWSVLFP